MRRAAIALLAATAAASCSYDMQTAPPAAVVAVGGRLERGLTVPVTMTVAGAPVAGAVFTVSPASAATVLAGDSLKLLEAGAMTVSARGNAGGDSVHASSTVTVAAPLTVVYDGIVAGNRDIYTVALDGTGLTRLTTNAADDRQPTARGGTVVFVRFGTGGATLYTVPLAGGTDAPLATATAGAYDDALSPDAAHLAYAQGSFLRIIVAGANGSAPARLIAADGGWSGAIEGSPSWSPAGDKIAYMTTRDGAAGIYIAAIAGASGSATQLVSGALGYANVEPAWSPDGLSIAFASNRGGPTDLYLVTIATGAVRQLTTSGNVGQPAWTADGRLLFTEYAGGTFGLRWLDPADTSMVHTIPTGATSAQHPSEAR